MQQNFYSSERQISFTHFLTNPLYALTFSQFSSSKAATQQFMPSLFINEMLFGLIIVIPFAERFASPHTSKAA